MGRSASNFAFATVQFMLSALLHLTIVLNLQKRQIVQTCLLGTASHRPLAAIQEKVSQTFQEADEIMMPFALELTADLIAESVGIESTLR